MAELAKEYYEKLQTQFLTPKKIKEAKTKETPENINIQLEEIDKQELNEILKEKDIEKIIKCLPNGKATGTDGIPYEFWKKLNKEYHIDASKEQPPSETYNIAKTLTTVFNDIEKHGIIEETNFTKG